MASDRSNKANEYLHIPGVTHASDTVFVERFPLSYMPGESTELNRARLPRHADLAGMELAYRQESASSTTKGMARINHIILWCLLLPPLIVAVPRLMDFGYLQWIGPIISAILILTQLTRGRLDFSRLLGSLVLPSLLVGAAIGLGMLLQIRLLALFLLVIFSLVAFVHSARIPFDFYSQWAHTHPRLKPETRRAAQRIKGMPNYLVLLLTLAAAIVVPFFSNSLAILVVLGIVIAFGVPSLTKRHFRQMKKVMSVFATYRPAVQIPGVWIPSPLKILLFKAKFTGVPRWRLGGGPLLIYIVAPIIFTLSVSLYMYSFWDIPNVGLPDIMSDLTKQSSYGFVEAEYFQMDARWSTSTWIHYAFQAFYNGNFTMAWLFPVALALAFVIPSFLFMGIYRGLLQETMAIDKRIEGFHNKDGSYTPALDEDGRTEWQWYLDRIRRSKHSASDPLSNTVREAEHLFLGIEPKGDLPVLLDETVLKEHCYIVGETGSGKTALGVIPILTQLIRGHQRDPGNAKPNPEDDPSFAALEDDDHDSPCPPIVILDLKGDAALFHSIRAEAQGWAKRTGRKIDDVFQFFTPEPAKDTFKFNPLSDFLAGERSLSQLTQLLLDSLALSHGEGYGRSYYTRRNRQLLNAALLDAKEKNQLPKDIPELYAYVENLARTRSTEFKDAFELISTLHSLSQYQAIAHDPDLKRYTIHMPTLLQQRQISYFWLPAAIESVSIRELGKMAIFALLSAAIDRQRTGKPYRQAYLVIDEFQRLTGENFKVILEQARSFGIANILANQTQGDLKTADTDLRPTIRTNTRAKMYFSLSDPEEVQALSQSSGEEISYMRSYSTTYGGSQDSHSETEAQSLKPRLIRNDILRASDHPLEFILQVSRGSGYTQFGGIPIPVRTTFPHHNSQYKAFMEEPWPSLKHIPELNPEIDTPTEKDDKADELKAKWVRTLEKDYKKYQSE